MGSYPKPSLRAVHQPNGRGNNGPLTLIRGILIDDALTPPMSHKRGNRENFVAAVEMRPSVRAPIYRFTAGARARQRARSELFAPNKN